MIYTSIIYSQINITTLIHYLAVTNYYQISLKNNGNRSIVFSHLIIVIVEFSVINMVL